jgi:hypothetical protein
MWRFVALSVRRLTSQRRLAAKEAAALERELVLTETARLVDRARRQVEAGRGDTITVGKSVQDFQTRLRDVTRKMMALIAELSMLQVLNRCDYFTLTPPQLCRCSRHRPTRWSCSRMCTSASLSSRLPRSGYSAARPRQRRFAAITHSRLTARPCGSGSVRSVVRCRRLRTRTSVLLRKQVCCQTTVLLNYAI